MSDVLVLNASYEQLARVSWERAITLVVQEKAVIEEAVPDKFVRHQRGQMLWPRIIRLVKYVKIPYRFGPEVWTKGGVLKRDKKLCGYCEKKATTVDHIIPISKGGGVRDWNNTIASCFDCNQRKADRTPQEAHMRLLVEPYTPKGLRRRLGTDVDEFGL
jgi:5-methylcytosine-specific restriction endonuclease McrA